MDTNKKLKISVKDIPYIYIDNDILSGTLEEVAKNILGLREKLKVSYLQRQSAWDKSAEKRNQPRFTPFEDYKYIDLYVHSNYEDSWQIEIEVSRDETEEEFQKRIETNKKKSEAAKIAAKNRKLAQEKREKSLLETLKKKYE